MPASTRAICYAMTCRNAYKKGHYLILNIRRDSSHSFGVTNDAVFSTVGRNLLHQESLSFPELLSRYFFCDYLGFVVSLTPP